MSNKPAIKSPLFVKRSDSKKGKLWSKYANDRIIKQHGGYDIPEGDLHAVHKYESPISTPKINPDAMNATLSDIEKEIEKLKADDQHSLPSSSQVNKPQNRHEEDDDEDYDRNKRHYSDDEDDLL